MRLFSDVFLMREIKLKRHYAFRYLHKYHYEKCYQLAWRQIFIKADAQDIVQNVFFKIWNNSNLWSEQKNTLFSTWLYRVVLNACIDFNKKHARVSFDNDIEQTSPVILLDSLEQDQQQIQLQSALLGLSEIQRQVVNLFYYEALSSKQIATILTISVKSVEAHLSRARKKLKIVLLKDDK